MTKTTYAARMPSFLVVYDRSQARTLEMRRFEQDEHQQAVHTRHERELQELDNPEIEVVLFEAASEEDLRRTHGRYFDLAAEIASRKL